MKSEMEEAKSKLDKEMYNLAILKEAALKSNQLTKGMCNILTSFDERLMKLEQTILPVYHETGNLQRRQNNIEKTMEYLDYYIQFYNVAREVEPIIRDGPRGCLTMYLEAMEKLVKAIEFFKKNNPHKHQLEQLLSLCEHGGSALEKEFRNLLCSNSKTMPTIMILDLLGLDDEIFQGLEKPTFDQLPEKVIDDLILIANWLRKYRNGDFTSVYATIRSKTLVQSLKNLKEHLKSCSGNSNTLPAHNSPLLGGRRNARENAVRRTSRRGIQNVFIKKASAAFMKYSPTVESAVLGQRFQTSLLPDAKDDIIEQELEAYLTSISALCKLMQSELQLMHKIITPEEQVAVFDRVVQQALDNVISEGEGLAARVKKCAARHDFATALSLFPVLRHLNVIKPEFDGIFQKGTSELRSRLQGLTKTLQQTINKALEDFVDCIKNDPDTKMPKDGTVHELTSNVMIMLEQLQDYMDMLGTVLNNQDLNSFNDDGDINKTALAQYIMRVLSALGLALQNKSEFYSDPYLKAIFRLNNLHYILKSLQRTNLIDIVSKYSPDLEDYYNDQICDQKRIYSQSWSRVLHYVLEIDKPISTALTQVPTLKLKDKDRQNIKDKFTGFNKEMEEIYRIQKAYAIPDVELRESLKHDNKEFILPKYQMFYDKYASFHFTKNPEKYLKYLPIDVSNMIDKFFDAAA